MTIGLKAPTSQYIRNPRKYIPERRTRQTRLLYKTQTTEFLGRMIARIIDLAPDDVLAVLRTTLDSVQIQT